jgi:hypothetical protein
VSQLGANFFLQKPVKYQDIVTTVRTLIRAGPQPGAPMATRQVPKEEETLPPAEFGGKLVDPSTRRERD